MKFVRMFLVTAIWCISIAVTSNASAQDSVDFGQLREMIDGGLKKVEQDLYLTGVVISDFGNDNLELNANRHYSAVKTDMNNRRAYIESPDGKYGFRLGFKSSKQMSQLKRYSTVCLNLKGATLAVNSPKRYSIYNLTDESVVSAKAGTASDLPRKVKGIDELTSEDIYTFVTLRDCEFAFKDGSYCNVYETYTMATKLNKGTGANNSMDCWATLLHDGDARTVYMLVNTRSQWRRTGAGVPQGSGTLSGIVVYQHLPRYGGNVLGGYAIRPLDEGDINLAKEGASQFKTLAEWNWNDGAPVFLTDKGNVKNLRTERIKPDFGAGALYMNVDGTAVRSNDYNNPAIESSSQSWNRGIKGMRRNGAMLVRAEAGKWWNWEQDRGNALVVELSTAGLSGKNMFLAFSFGAGELRANNSYAFPVYWGVEYSTDGENFFRVKCDDIVLRSLPWWWFNNVNGANYTTSTETGMGLTEHLVRLPAALLGRDKVYLRLAPVRKNAATLASERSNNGALRPNLKTMTSISFGAIAVKYN